ncbi:MAG TPA: hypothetical protein VNE62_00600 [Actinomycetota bacterium]|nr:hypothetical protein [Actinomycetota bacterium]
MRFRTRAAVVAVAAALLAGLNPLGGPAQAAECGADVVVWTLHGVIVPDDSPTGQRVFTPLYDSRTFGCAASPDVEFNTGFVYPGANLIKALHVPGGASQYCFAGLALNRCDATIIYTSLTGGARTESHLLALDPTQIGCVNAWFNVTSPHEYCTLTHLTP